MAGFTAKIDMLEIRKEFTVDMEKACRELMRNAAKYWLVEILKRIPIRTGFLVGSFRGLEDYLGISGSNVTAGGGFYRQLNRKHQTVADFQNRIIKHFTTARNKRLQLLEKQQNLELRISRLERQITQTRDRSAFTGRHKSMTGEFGAHRSEISKEARHGLGSREAGKMEQILERNARIRKRIETLTKRYNKVTKVIDKMNKTGNFDVIRKLNSIREQIRKLNAAERKLHGVDVNNPQVGHEKARHAYKYEAEQREVEISQAERMKRLREKKGKIEKQYQEIVKKVRYELRPEKKLLAFKEYYIHTDRSKTLKTPSSGVRFATDPEKAFTEFSTGQLGILQRLATQAQSAAEYRSRGDDLITADKTEGAESTAILNEQFKASVIGDLYKQILNTKVFFEFNFQVSISYFDVNDFHKKGKFGQRQMPWGAQAAAATAFLSYLQHNALNKLPKIDSLVGTTQLNYTGRTTPVTTRADIT